MRTTLRYRFRPAWGACLALLLALPVPAALAANGDCGIPVTSGSRPTTADCLFVLRAGVKLVPCAPCVCDTDGNASVNSADALLCLRAAVHQPVQFACPACPATGGCPGVVEWTTHAAYGATCGSNADCTIGACDGATGRCHTATDLDLGWTGMGHDGDLADGAVLRLRVDCSGEGPACGECSIAGIDPSAGACHCQYDPRISCDEPFTQDKNDCPACFAGAFVGHACATNAECSAGPCARRCENDLTVVCSKTADCPGGSCIRTTKCSSGKNCVVEQDCTGTCTTGSRCECYDGPPIPLSVGGTPFCVVHHLAGPVTGTVDVDSGRSALVKNIKAVVYSGITTTSPCPVCGGSCSNDGGKSCSFDSECGQGNTCQLDPVARDGERGGVCVGGPSNGLACDVDATNTSFPAVPGQPGGAGYSLDCTPTPGSNSSGAGIRFVQTESTATGALAATLSCGDQNPGLMCPCRVCSTDVSLPCSSDAECAHVQGTCSASAQTGVSEPNGCVDHLCSDAGDGEGACATGPDATFCDAVVRASGRGILACTTNDDCSASVVGVSAGNCGLLRRRPCFPDPIVATGEEDPHRPVLAATFCWSPLSTAGKTAAFGLPGPGRIRRQTSVRAFCASAPQKLYVPGEGGCPP